MKKYVLDGTVKSFELWNPINLGKLAGYAVANLASGTIKIAAGQKFNAPGLGLYTILPAAAGTGPSVVLGPPFVFTKANVAQFNF
jgi:rhamnose transport system substrate-binding protein